MNRLAATLLILLSARVGATQIPILEPSAFCQLMLTPGAAETQRLSETVLAQIGEQLNRNKLIGQFSYMQDMRDVMVELVTAGTITQAQAEMLFAERVLGNFNRIFLKYTFAELMERGFSNEDIVQFMLHFDNAYNSSKQVEFAVDVSRRMLLTINEDTGIQSAQGLKNFLTLARAFGIPAETYSNFLQLWVYIRAAHPGTIVYFILSNIKNAGYALHEQLDQATHAPALTAVARPKLSRWWAWAIPPVEEYTSPADTVTRELLDVDLIPESIRHPFAGFKPNTVTYHNFLDRFWAQTDTDLAIYLDDLEQRPPFAREFIINQQLPELTFARLDQFAQTPFYQRLSPQTRQRGDQILNDFKRLRELEERLNFLAPRTRKRDRERPPTTSQSAVTQFEQSLAFYWTRVSTFKSQRDVQDLIIHSYTLIKTRFGNRLGAEDFLSIASKLLGFSFAKKNLEQAHGGLMALQKISRDFDLSAKQLAELYNLLDRDSILMKNTQFSARHVPTFAEFFAAGAFGSGAADPAAAEAEIKELLTEIREILSRYGMPFKNLEDVHKRIAHPKVPEPIKFLPLTPAPRAYS